VELVIALVIAIVVLYLLISLNINTGHIAESLDEIISVLKAERETEIAYFSDILDGACEGCGKKVSMQDMLCPSCGLRIKH
jgi:hypothetical protein